MTDLLIRGTHFPRNGHRVFRIYADGRVEGEYTGIPLGAAIELPPHGDLISKAETMNAILGEPPEAHYPSWYASIVNEIPAIVPSNKEECFDTREDRP